MHTKSKIFLFVLFAISTTVYGNLNDISDINLLKSLEDLQAQVLEIKYQYVSITSNLEKIKLDIPYGLQSFPGLFMIDNHDLFVGPDGNIYYRQQNMQDYICELNNYSDDSCSGTNETNQTRSGYVTIEEFNQLATLVNSLSATCQTLSNNLSAISDTVLNITQQINAASSAIQRLNMQCEALNQRQETFDRAIDIKEDGRLVLSLSPLGGNRESQSTPFLFQYPSIWSWDKICSKFNVVTNAHLNSITLYCNDTSKIPLPESVYISAAEEQNGNYQMTYWYCSSVNTGAFPFLTYTFTNPILIRSDRPHLLGIRKIGDNLIYPYVCTGYRNGKLYKPYGASENEPGLGPGQRIGDPPSPPDPPTMTLTQYMDMYFTLYMVPCVFNYEIWSVFHFSEDIDFIFNDNGLEIKKGYLSEEIANVLTDSNFGTVITNNPEILGNKITWDSFCQSLKSYLITAAGGTINGELTVASLILSNAGSWHIGNSATRSDIIINNQNGCITTSNGDLNLACNGDNSKINIQNFAHFGDSEQCGKVTIEAGDTSHSISSALSQDAVVTVTPCQQTDVKYWVEIDSLGVCSVVIEGAINNNLSFYYVIMRK